VGPWAEPSCEGEPVSDLDIAPLVLDLLGYPRSEEMAGAGPTGCLAGLARRPDRVQSYGMRRLPAVNPTSDYEPEMIERLKSLGYLK